MKGEARIVGGLVAPGSPASLSLVLTERHRCSQCGGLECEHDLPGPCTL